jgi:hypothetical protein
MLVIALIDVFIDRLFESAENEDDILEFRGRMATSSRGLGIVMDIAAHRPGGPRVLVGSQPVPIERYSALSVEDFMVSLYNNHSIQQLIIAGEHQPEAELFPVLERALADLAKIKANETGRVDR